MSLLRKPIRFFTVRMRTHYVRGKRRN